MLGNASPSGAGGAGGGGGGGGKGWGWGRREVGTGDTIFLGSTGGTESLAMLPMARFGEVVAIPIDNDKCHDGHQIISGACWQPLNCCALETPVLSAKLGLRVFLYRVYDVTFFVLEEKKCRI